MKLLSLCLCFLLWTYLENIMLCLSLIIKMQDGILNLKRLNNNNHGGEITLANKGGFLTLFFWQLGKFFI